LTTINRNVENGYPIPSEVLLDQEVRGTLAQDKDIMADDNEIRISGPDQFRKYTVSVRYSIRGAFEKQLEYKGTTGAF
jgi:hypothetical protein